MQHTRPPNFPLLFPSFKKHRSSLDQSRLGVKLTLPKPTAVPAWASLPTPPMSGSPPPEPPSDPPQIAGYRRKRSETPPTTTAPPTISPPTPLERPLLAPIAHAGREVLTGDGPSQTFSYSSSYPPPVTHGSTVPMGVITASPPEPLFLSGSVSPKAVRKTKAHVASACVNCKKKHLRCDNARPCRRCIQSGKEDTCKDTEHKKRGRPPLRPDDPSSRPRSFDPTMTVMPGPPAEHARRLGSTDPGMYAPSTYSRTFRPLQAQPPPYDPTRTQMRPSQGYPMYAPPSIQPSPATAVGSFIPARQYGSGQPMMGTQPPSPYMMSPSDAPRPTNVYGSGYGYPSPQEQMSMQPPPFYSAPLFPRSQLPPSQSEQIMTPASLQLPPIRGAPERSPIDPALVQQGPTSQGSSQEQSTASGTTRQPDPKRPRMDLQRILDPRND